MAGGVMDEQRLDKIEARANAATEGVWSVVWAPLHHHIEGFPSCIERCGAGAVPWRERLTSDGRRLHEFDPIATDIVSATGKHVVCMGHDHCGGGEVDNDDARFVAAARDDVPALVAEVRRLREAGRALARLGTEKFGLCPCCHARLWPFVSSLDSADKIAEPHHPDCPWPAFVEAFGD